MGRDIKENSKKQRVTDAINTKDIRNWNIGDIITITAGTGKGKSYFIKNVLYTFAKENNKKILMLIHRNNCVNQFNKEIKKAKKDDVIDIRTYQSIESLYINHKKNYDFSEYQYIVCDEFHYFMSDAAFNKTTDISLNMILEQTSITRIFMSATGDYVKKYLNNKKKIDTINYNIPTNYDFIKNLTFFSKNETLEKFIEEAIEKNDKAIFFIQSAKEAYKLHKKYKKYTLFNCSKSNDDYYKYVDVGKIDLMLENEKFEELILITTTCFDAGVNILDTDVKHIVIDVKDIGSLIQCIGRKRIQHEEDKIYLYIKTINNKQLGGMKKKLKEKIKKADFLHKHTVKEYIEEYPRENDYNNIVYDVIVDEDDKGTKKINELMYFKCKTDIVDIDVMIRYGNFGYCKYLASKFGFVDADGRHFYRIIDEEYKKDDLEEYLNSILGKTMLQVADRKELIEKIDVKSNGRLLKRIRNLNGALEEREIPYRIVEFSTSKMIEGKQRRYPNCWKVEKLIS